jgi:sodium transport system ATP-binding protein
MIIGVRVRLPHCFLWVTITARGQNLRSSASNRVDNCASGASELWLYTQTHWHIICPVHSAAMLELHGVRKTFFDRGRGPVHAVDDINLTLTSGVCALVGANGAGKSTLLRLITTLLMPDAGTISLHGLSTATHADSIRQRLAYLSSTTRMYQRLTGRELLRYVGGFFALTGATLDERIAAVSDTFQLSQFLDQRIEGLSTGQLQRINLARTLLPDPELLILDEPTTGLDVLAAQSLITAVQHAKRPGRLIIIATHILREVEQCAEQLVIMRQGRVIYHGPPAALGGGVVFEQAIHHALQHGHLPAINPPSHGVETP